jgi:hypothetical protein
MGMRRRRRKMRRAMGGRDRRAELAVRVKVKVKLPAGEPIRFFSMAMQCNAMAGERERGR